jgi:flagellar FliJ protein
MYRFKLETLLNHRRHQEEVCQKQLAQTEKQLADERKKLDRMKQKKRENTQELQAKQKIQINVSIIALTLNFIRQLSMKIEQQTDRVRLATRKVNQKRSELVMIVKKRKTLEKLKEKEQLAHQQTILQSERKLMDEVAGIRHVRKMQ